MGSSFDYLREPWLSELVDDYAATYGLSRTEAMRRAVAALAVARRQAPADRRGG